MGKLGDGLTPLFLRCLRAEHRYGDRAPAAKNPAKVSTCQDPILTRQINS